MANGEVWLPTESNPSTDCKKIVTVDYVREANRCANLDANPSTVGALG